MLLALVSGCMTAERPSQMGCGGGYAGHMPTVPGVQGPWGQPVAMASPYSVAPPGAMAAQAMMAQSVPLDLVQMNGAGAGGMPPSIMPAGGLMGTPGSGVVQASGSCISPPGVPYAPVTPGMTPPPGAVAAAGALTGTVPGRFPSQRTSVRFINPPGMRVSWYTPKGTSRVGFDNNQLETPGRYNFVQGAIYRLKFSHIANRPGLELYPTLEVVPASMKTESFLAHSSVPVTLTDEDLEQVAAGNFLVKVIYLPDPQFQDLATTGPDEVVSSRLEPGADPIAEARRRGSILLVVRLGNIDLEAPNTPPMEAPNPYILRSLHPQGAPGHSMAPGPMSPYGPMLPPGKVPVTMGPTGNMPVSPAGVPAAQMLPEPSFVNPTSQAQAGAANAALAAGSDTPAAPASDAPPPQRRHFWWQHTSADDK
jgi:hypothetical protein